jgi:hypothetical protein
MLEGYVEASLTNGDVVCWCLDVRWNQDSWVVEATLDRKTGDRSETVRELTAEAVNDFDGFLRVLSRVVRELLALKITDAAPELLTRLR